MTSIHNFEDDKDQSDQPAEEPGHPRVSDSVFDAMPEYKPFAIMYPDGMPVDHTPDVGDDAQAPPLSPDTLVCMAQPQKDGTILPKCRFYARQKARDSEIGVWVIQRWCVHPSLKGTNGAALSLRDSAVPCCELRDPPDARSTESLDAFDAMRIRQGADRKAYRVFKTQEDVDRNRTTVPDDE